MFLVSFLLLRSCEVLECGIIVKNPSRNNGYLLLSKWDIPCKWQRGKHVGNSIILLSKFEIPFTLSLTLKKCPLIPPGLLTYLHLIKEDRFSLCSMLMVVKLTTEFRYFYVCLSSLENFVQKIMCLVNKIK
uniref:Secreted protein n=1 Tax=Cacopsylla melanoneura TaxID=428564 RepID=A0A8D8UCW0_9HEMI